MEFDLNDFVVYIDGVYYLNEMCLFYFLDMWFGYLKYYFDGIFSVGEFSYFVRWVVIVVLFIEGYMDLEVYIV